MDIEREVELGGPLHSKGMLILQGYLSGRYLPDAPLSVSASLVFEQSYGGVRERLFFPEAIPSRPSRFLHQKLFNLGWRIPPLKDCTG